MLTPDGEARMLNALALIIDGGYIQVSDGTQTAHARFDGPPLLSDDCLTVTATFGPDEANFEWATRSVLAKDSVPIDTQDEDQGRKAQGTIWTLSVDLCVDNGEEVDP